MEIAVKWFLTYYTSISLMDTASKPTIVCFQL